MRLNFLSFWYLKLQFNYYKQGIRGTHDKDVFGKMMAPMAATLADDTAMANVVAILRARSRASLV